MGVDAGDYNGDGRLDLVETQFFARLHDALREQRRRGLFTDVSYAAGVAVRARAVLGWGVGFVDIDNNGLLDLFVANGTSIPRSTRTAWQRTTASASSCSGTWATGGFRTSPAQSAAALLLEKSSRGAAFGDYDNDGDIDVLVVNMDDRPTLLRNDTTAAATGSRSGWWAPYSQPEGRATAMRSARRSRLSAGGRRRSARCGAAAAISRRTTCACTSASATPTAWTRVEIRWPSGRTETLTGLAADRFYVAREGRGVQQK